MISKVKLIWQVTWQYLNQPVFDANHQTILRLDRFWYIYRVEFLERCWQQTCESERHHL